MPVMSGLQLCAALYNAPNLRAIPIILCSAAADIPVQPHPTIAYARKPFHSTPFIAMLQRMGG